MVGKQHIKSPAGAYPFGQPAEQTHLSRVQEYRRVEHPVLPLKLRDPMIPLRDAADRKGTDPGPRMLGGQELSLFPDRVLLAGVIYSDRDSALTGYLRVDPDKGRPFGELEAGL